MAAEPTVPKVILSPFTEPVRFDVPAVESVIRPLTFDPVCVQSSWNVPVNAPL